MKTTISVFVLTLLVTGAASAAGPTSLKKRRPDKIVVLTFDDSCASQATFAAPLLKKMGFNATFFITEGFSFHTNKKAYMTWKQIKELHKQGFEIGNHTKTHAKVKRRPEAEIIAEIKYIDEVCKKHGIPKPVSFAYPGLSLNGKAIKIVKALGFKYARGGYKNDRAWDPNTDDPLVLPHIFNATPKGTLEKFKTAMAKTKKGQIPILLFHGVPDVEHKHVSTSPQLFIQYMKYLREDGYTGIAVRDIAKYTKKR